MSERSLAHVERIVDIQPIEGADKIEVATVLGWQVVVKKGEFKVGDCAVYIEIDSIVPDIPYFEFMQDRKFRVRTIKLKKQISQGLLVSMNDFENIVNSVRIKSSKHIVGKVYNLGQDVTNLIDIKKYESPSDKEQNEVQRKKHSPIIAFLTRFSFFRKLFKIKSKSFPDWISKTDEERIQNIPSILSKEHPCKFYATEKLDGQSATYWVKKKFSGYEFGICSRAVRKFEHDGSNWSKVAKQFCIKEILINLSKSLGCDIAIQGEILSPKIQGGKYHNNVQTKILPLISNQGNQIKGYENSIAVQRSVEFPFDFYIFNMYNITTKEYFTFEDMVSVLIGQYSIGLKMVPIISSNFVIPSTMEGILSLAEGKSVLANVEREGIVVRSWDQKVSFKVISNKFLMKEE